MKKEITYKIRIKGVITDDTFDDFLKLLELHKAQFFGSYNDKEIVGDLLFNQFDMIVSIHD